MRLPKQETRPVTKLHDPRILRQLARVLEQPDPAPRRLIPVLQWTVNPETGHPVGRWTIPEEPEGQA
jgi:hypothetical protein